MRRIARLRRGAVTSALILAAALVGQSPAAATGSCAFAGGVADVTLAGDGDATSISVDGQALEVDGSPCGTATTSTVDLVRVRDTSAGGSTTVTVDERGGAFAPGATPEPASPEIELDLDLGTGVDDSIVVQGGGEADTVIVGDAGVNLNGNEADGVDADVTLAGVERLQIEAGNGNDTLSAAGGAATGNPIGTPVSLLGGAGADTLIGGDGGDTLDGGSGYDVADYSAQLTALDVTLDGVANDGRAGEGDDVRPTVEEVVGGSGDDHIAGSDFANELHGGPGSDTLEGRGGDDTLRGGPGNDTLLGELGFDLLEGGPDDDVEDGGDNNDVFQQSPPTIYRSTDGVTLLADATAEGPGITVLQIPVTQPGQMRDINVRVDIEQTSEDDLGPNGYTGQLEIVTHSPFGVDNPMSMRNGNGSPMRGTTFDSEAVETIRLAGAAPLDGRFHPRGSLDSLYRGKPALGTWELVIRDEVPGGVGQLNWWALEINYPTAGADGMDRLIGGVGNLDLADYTGRSRNLSITLDGVRGDGQRRERDTVGAPVSPGVGDIENVYSGIGNDTIRGTDGPSDLRGHYGHDTIYGLGGNDKIRGGQGNDVIYAGAGDDGTIYGNQGADSIFGEDGNDRIDGGSQVDTIDGGAGSNICRNGEIVTNCG